MTNLESNKISVDITPCAICGISTNESHIDNSFIEETLYHNGTYEKVHRTILNCQINPGVIICDKCDLILGGLEDYFNCRSESLFKKPQVKKLVKLIVENPTFLRSALNERRKRESLSKEFIEQIIYVLGLSWNDFDIKKNSPVTNDYEIRKPSDNYRKNLDMNFYRYQIQLFIEAKRKATFAEIKNRFQILTDQEILLNLSELVDFNDIIRLENEYSVPIENVEVD